MTAFTMGMRKPELSAVFARAVALAVASTTCVVACGARTNLASDGDEEDDAETVGPAPKCAEPPPVADATATCRGSGPSYDFSCQATWGVARPPDLTAGASLTLDACGEVCGAPPDFGAECGHYCAGAAAAECEVGCAWVTCRVWYGGGGSVSSNAGRRPPGFASTTGAPCDLAGYFAANAELEAASVFAFRFLASELEAHDAPRALVRAAVRAAEEEERHTVVMNGLARRFGGEGAAPVDVRPGEARTLASLALDNAVEGCVNETYAALLATWQAERAGDREVRAAMKTIAADETAHARFSWALHAWAVEGLSAAERGAVAEARARAVEKLRRSAVCDGVDEESRRLAGLPSTREALALVGSLAADLYG